MGEERTNREYLLDIDDIPEIPEHIDEKFREVLVAFESYAEHASLPKDQLQSEKDRTKELKLAIEKNDTDKELAVMKAKEKLEDEKRDLERDIQGQKERYEILLDEKEKTIELYKDMKTRMSER